MIQREHQDDRDLASGGIAQIHPLSVIVGAHRISPCDYETYARFKLWVAATLTDGTIDTYRAGDVSIAHWDDSAGAHYPHLSTPANAAHFCRSKSSPVRCLPAP